MNVFDKDKTLLLWTPQMGLVVRQDGVLKYISKGVDASQELVDGEYEWRENHLDQPTAAQQPRLVGGIAPNSKVAAANLNGESRYFTHPAISFADGEAWSVSFYGSLYGNISDQAYLCGDITKTGTIITLFSNITFRSNSGDLINFFTLSGVRYRYLLGKSGLFTITANASKLVSLYFNGLLVSSGTGITTDAIFNSLLRTRDTSTAAYNINGYLSAYHIQSGALTPTQVLAEYNLLRSMYPEIESVDIGAQTWATRNFEAVATPQGNVIANVTENGAVEKITNAADREFSRDTGFWTKQTGWVIADGVAKITTPQAAISALYRGVCTIGKWYKITLTINSISGTLRVLPGGSITFSTPGTKEVYIKSVNINAGWDLIPGSTAEVDNIYIKELGWAEADEIYDAVYAATVGDAATKEYAALKEAAMWRYPNNSIDKGAWGGKLYNKYAMMLLSLDMASANFGYHIPTNAEVVELLAQVGGDTNKLKYVGLDYWNDAIGTNESGLTLLGTGVITPGGVYTGEKELTGFWTSDSNEIPTSGLPIRIVKNV